jgi:hypothetical protein
VATPDGVFAATERDNDEDGSLLKVLRFDTGSSAKALDAVAEWDVTDDLPASATTAASRASPGSRTPS